MAFYTQQDIDLWEDCCARAIMAAGRSVLPEEVGTVRHPTLWDPPFRPGPHLYKLPFVTKADLREAYPYGLVAKPLKECVRIQSTSGTTGKQGRCRRRRRGYSTEWWRSGPE